ncbi:ABC transporter ATP-binding protein [Streptomyces hirsutus]|uniref:ABC transporter ATP-binding protein n=1 Tax=Streptomyces hirsutus TaxID=35620 RepID=UPI00342CA156
MTETLLDVEDLTTGYGQVPVVRGLSLKVSAGEIVALLGPNGAGKTTSLLAVMGLLPVSAGKVAFPGAATRRRHPAALARSGVIFVPDDRGLCPGLSVGEHFRLAARKGPGAAIDEVLDHFPALRPLRSRKAGLLSGGEQQMLAIAKSLLAAPRLLLIDEMSLGLAPKIVAEMFPAIRAQAKERGIGVVLVEQHTDIALATADKALVLNHGETVLAGPAQELLKDRARLREAYFSA